MRRGALPWRMGRCIKVIMVMPPFSNIKQKESILRHAAKNAFFYNSIEDAINDAFVGCKDYCDGERIQFNKYAIFHKDIIDSANGIDKLVSSTFSRNEINEFINLPHIDEDWADEHNLTKNYGNVKGGVNDEK